MNITYLFGNGFDLNLNLKTGYSNFYKSLTLDKIADNDIYKEIVYFTFENDIPPKICEYFVEVSDDNFKKSTYKMVPIKNVKMFFGSLSTELKNSVIEQMISPYSLWRDLELGIGKYVSEIKDNASKYKFLDDFAHLIQDLKTYLVKENSKFDMVEDDDFDLMALETFKYFFKEFKVKNARNDISTIVKFSEDEEHNYNFITFNYTDTIEKIIKKMKERKSLEQDGQYNNKLNSVVYIHGKLHSNQILLGVNDFDQLSDVVFDRQDLLYKMVIKPMSNDSIDRSKNVKCDKIINESNIICLYGLSLSETDKRWYRLILDRLFSDSKLYVIIYWYNELYTNISIFEDWILEENIKHKLYSHLPEERIQEYIDKINDRILIMINSKLFKFDKASYSKYWMDTLGEEELQIASTEEK